MGSYRIFTPFKDYLNLSKDDLRKRKTANYFDLLADIFLTSEFPPGKRLCTKELLSSLEVNQISLRHLVINHPLASNYAKGRGARIRLSPETQDALMTLYNRVAESDSGVVGGFKIEGQHLLILLELIKLSFYAYLLTTEKPSLFGKQEAKQLIEFILARTKYCSFVGRLEDFIKRLEYI